MKRQTVVRHGIEGRVGIRWGVRFDTPFRGRPYLITEAWSREADERKPFAGEMPRVLMFKTRRHAREWCQRKRAEYAGRTGPVKTWKFRPVKVEERITAVSR